MSRVLIKGGHIVDPSTGQDGVGDLYIGMVVSQSSNFFHPVSRVTDPVLNLGW